MKIVVAGTGYVGLVTGACLSEVGHSVTCVDIDEKKIRKMKQGISPIYEPDLEELLKRNHKEGRLDFTVDYKNAYKDADLVFIGVGTPEKEDGSVNLDYVFNVCEQIAENLQNDCLVVVKSTVPIGTNDKVEEFLKEHLKNNVQIEIASNPEFLAQGTAVKDTLYANRIVIGVESDKARDTLRKVYERFNQPIVVTNRRSAEMIKYASNDFLALKISFMNEVANLCEIVGADIEDVAEGMSYDPRIGDKFLKAGIGYGGSCFPKDTKALHWLANDNSYELKTIKATIEVNENQKFKLFRKAKQRFESLKGMKVAVLGLTFKPGTDDLREAPSLPNVRKLLNEGAEIVAYDPTGEENFKRFYPTEINYVTNPEEALKEADLAFIFTEWEDIKSVPLSKYRELMKQPIIFDGRNCYSLNEAEESGVEYYSIGRKVVEAVDNKLGALEAAAITIDDKDFAFKPININHDKPMNNRPLYNKTYNSDDNNRTRFLDSMVGDFSKPYIWGIYLLITIIIFALIYLCPSFSYEINDKSQKMQSLWDALYFSGITLATIGYGDIVPLGWARLFCVVEGVIGVGISSAFIVSIVKKYLIDDKKQVSSIIKLK